jgi:hypothetical protein
VIDGIIWEMNVFQTSIADSLPTPAWLAGTQKLRRQGKPKGAELLNRVALARQGYGTLAGASA